MLEDGLKIKKRERKDNKSCWWTSRRAALFRTTALIGVFHYQYWRDGGRGMRGFKRDKEVHTASITDMLTVF